MRRGTEGEAMKVRNEPYMRAMQELRRSNAATRHRDKSKYTRKTKHKGRF